MGPNALKGITPCGKTNTKQPSSMARKRKDTQESGTRGGFRGVGRHGHDFVIAAKFRHVMTNLGDKLTHEEMYNLCGHGLVLDAGFTTCLVDRWYVRSVHTVEACAGMTHACAVARGVQRGRASL